MSVTKTEKVKEQDVLETRKVKALEKIASSLDALTLWFEEVDKQEWSGRIQWYLAEYHDTHIKPNKPTE